MLPAAGPGAKHRACDRCHASATNNVFHRSPGVEAEDPFELRQLDETHSGTNAAEAMEASKRLAADKAARKKVEAAAWQKAQEALARASAEDRTPGVTVRQELNPSEA